MTSGRTAWVWTTRLESRLRSAWGAGESAAMIGADLGISRSAVLGKARRMDLPRRQTPTMVIKAAERRQRSVSGLRMEPMVDKGAAWKALPGSTPISLLELEAGKCRWPIGDDSPYRFCGLPSGEASYCAHHADLSVGKGTSRERSAHRARDPRDRIIA